MQNELLVLKLKYRSHQCKSIQAGFMVCLLQNTWDSQNIPACHVAVAADITCHLFWKFSYNCYMGCYSQKLLKKYFLNLVIQRMFRWVCTHLWTCIHRCTCSPTHTNTGICIKTFKCISWWADAYVCSLTHVHTQTHARAHTHTKDKRYSNINWAPRALIHLVLSVEFTASLN